MDNVIESTVNYFSKYIISQFKSLPSNMNPYKFYYIKNAWEAYCFCLQRENRSGGSAFSDSPFAATVRLFDIFIDRELYGKIRNIPPEILRLLTPALVERTGGDDFAKDLVSLTRAKISYAALRCQLDAPFSGERLQEILEHIADGTVEYAMLIKAPKLEPIGLASLWEEYCFLLRRGAFDSYDDYAGLFRSISAKVIAKNISGDALKAALTGYAHQALAVGDPFFTGCDKPEDALYSYIEQLVNAQAEQYASDRINMLLRQ